MNRIHTIYLLLLLFPGFILGQQELNNWVFGEYVQLNFLTDPPTVINNTSFNNIENASAISDESGNLLFYTNGGTIINKNHVTMDNGLWLTGHSSSTQNLIIKGFNPNEYYVFYMQGCAEEQGYLSFSKVDMSLNAGLGKVTILNKQIYTGNLGEGITAIKHCNKQDYWICVRTFEEEPQMLSFLFTPEEKPFAPVKTLIPEWNDCTSYLKASPGGNLIAWEGGGFIADFNNSNGEISNIRTVPDILNSTASFAQQGLEFSPNSENLFSTSGIMVEIATLNTHIFYNNTTGPMQLANNGKIYISNQSHLHVIDSPNANISSLGFRENYIDLLGADAQLSTCHFSPTFFDTSAYFIFQSNCPGDPTVLYYADSNQVDSIKWVVEGTTYKGNQIEYNFNSSGTFNVQMITYTLGIVDTVNQCIPIYGPVNDFLPNDTIICSGDEIILSPYNYVNGSFTWNTNDTSTSITVDKEGQYFLNIENNCYTVSDSIFVALNPICSTTNINVPNIFSPNGDGLNDYFQTIINDETIDPGTLLMSVYSRWGNKVYTGNPITNPWDGANNGKTMSEGVYYWTLGIQSQIIKNGFVHLIINNNL